MKFKNITQYVLILTLAAGLTACSDSGSSAVEEDQEPALVELTANARPDISFFEENNPSSTTQKGAANADVNNYNAAKAAATGGTAILSYTSFFNLAAGIDADFEDDQWVWEYSGSQDGRSGSIRTTARPQDTGFSWETFISYQDEEGNSIDNVKVMDGSTRNSGNQGNWSFYNAFTEDADNSSPILSSSWTVVNETERSTELEIFDEEGTSVGTVNYEQDGAENTMTLDFGGDNDTAEVFWNTDTNEGYVKQGDDEATCWGNDFQDVSCTN
jgi:hypothetical protein